MFEWIKKFANSFLNKTKTNGLIDTVVKDTSYSFLWGNLWSCWEVLFNYETMFNIQRINTEAQQSKNLIVKMVWKKWIKFLKKNEVVTDYKWEKRIKDLFTDRILWSYRATRDAYYTNHFCSWMVFWYVWTNLLGKNFIQILDSRKVRQELDDFWNVKEIYYNEKKLDKKRVIKQITQYNPNHIWYWMSAYESVVYDAMSDKETSKRNYYFFKNNAMPWIILTLSDDIQNPDEIKQAIKQFENKYKWSEKAHWILASNDIKEVRMVDISNKDLELLELKKFMIKKMWVIFWFDPRFLWYKDDANWSHAEYKLMAWQSDKSMISFADIFEEFIMKAVNIVYNDFPYRWVELINDQFVDIETKQDLVLKKVEKWVITLKQWIKELWYSLKDVPDYMDTYMINTQRNSVENILNKSEKEIEIIWNEEKKEEKNDNKEEEKDKK